MKETLCPNAISHLDNMAMSIVRGAYLRFGSSDAMKAKGPLLALPPPLPERGDRGNTPRNRAYRGHGGGSAQELCGRREAASAPPRSVAFELRNIRTNRVGCGGPDRVRCVMPALGGNAVVERRSGNIGPSTSPRPQHSGVEPPAS
jgi:hypothetical protein